MIVVDTNLIVYLLYPGEHTSQAERVFEIDAEWAAPFLWRSEFRNVLIGYIRRGDFRLAEALSLIADAEEAMRGREFAVSSAKVLELSASSGCSAYDCEFVALAQDLGLRLVTSDRHLLRSFPQIATAPNALRHRVQ